MAELAAVTGAKVAILPNPRKEAIENTIRDSSITAA